MSTLVTKFNELKYGEFSKGQTRAGFCRIILLLKPSVYLKIVWEIITTVVMYSPSVNTFMKDIISSIEGKWNTLTETEQNNIVAALARLNKRCKVEKYL